MDQATLNQIQSSVSDDCELSQSLGDDNFRGGSSTERINSSTSFSRMLFLAIQLTLAQRTIICASPDGNATCPSGGTAVTWNNVNAELEKIRGDVTLYISGSTAENKMKLHEWGISGRSLKILPPETTGVFHVHVEVHGGGYFDCSSSEIKLNVSSTLADLWVMQGDSSVVLSGPWSNAQRVNILSATSLSVRLETSSVKLDIVSRRQLELFVIEEHTTIQGTISLLGSASLYENRIVYAGSSSGRVSVYITNLHVVGFLDLDSPNLDLQVRYMNSYGWEQFPIKFALGLSGLATLKVEKKWTSPWANYRDDDDPSWDDDFRTEDLSSETTNGGKDGRIVSAARTLDRDEPDDIVVTLLNKVKCGAQERVCYVSDDDASQLTSRNWTIVTGPSSSFEFRRFDYELFLSNATDQTPYGFEASNHIFDITSRAGDFNVDSTTLTIFAKTKPSEHPFHLCYAQSANQCPNKRITTHVSASDLSNLKNVVPSEIKNVWLAVESNLAANEKIDLNSLPTNVENVIIFSDDDRRDINFVGNSNLASLTLSNVNIPSTSVQSVALDNPVVTFVDVKADGVSFSVGANTLLRTPLSLYKKHFAEQTLSGLELLGMENYKYVYFYSDKWIVSKKKIDNPNNYTPSGEAFELLYNKLNGNFSFELGDELEEVTDSAKVLSWWDDWHDETERLNLIPVFNDKDSVTVRPMTIISTEDSIEIFISEEWKNVSFVQLFGDAITVSHGRFSVTINSEYDSVPVSTEGTGIVRIWRNIEVDSQGRPVFLPDLVMRNGEYGFSVSFSGVVKFPFGKLDISGNSSLVLVNNDKSGSSELSVGDVYCHRGSFFRFTQIKITGKLTLEANSDLVPENFTNPEIEFTAETDVELRWYRGYVPMIDIGREVSKRPRKIVLKYDSSAETDLTASGYNQIWQSEKYGDGQVVVRGVNMDCDSWMKLVTFESDIKGFSADGAFGFECRRINDSVSASRLLAGEVENAVYMKMNTALKDSDLHGPNVGAIVGGVIGAVAFIAIVAVIVFFVIKKRKDSSSTEEQKQQLTGDGAEP